MNLERRRIEARARTVHVARDLTCPASRQAGFDLVKSKLEAGIDVNAHLSKSVAHNADYDDMTLNDWGFHHLHLGTALMPNGLIQRTGELLFAYLTQDDAYLVGVGDHHDWAAARLNVALFDNWPKLFEGRTLSLEVDDEMTATDRIQMRNAGVLVVTKLPNGKAVFPLGGGYATSKRSLDVTQRIGRIWQEVAELERRFSSMVPEIVAGMLPHGIQPEEMCFHLHQAEDGTFFAEDRTNAISVKLFEPKETEGAERSTDGCPAL